MANIHEILSGKYKGPIELMQRLTEYLHPKVLTRLDDKNTMVTTRRVSAADFKPHACEFFNGKQMFNGKIRVPVKEDSASEIRNINESGGISNVCVVFSIYKGMQAYGSEIPFSKVLQVATELGLIMEDTYDYGTHSDIKIKILEHFGFEAVSPEINQPEDISKWIENGYLLSMEVMEIWPDDLDPDVRIDFHEILCFGIDTKNKYALIMDQDLRDSNDNTTKHGLRTISLEALNRLAWDYESNKSRTPNELELYPGTKMYHLKAVAFRPKNWRK